MQQPRASPELKALTEERVRWTDGHAAHPSGSQARKERRRQPRFGSGAPSPRTARPRGHGPAGLGTSAATRASVWHLHKARNFGKGTERWPSPAPAMCQHMASHSIRHEAHLPAQPPVRTRNDLPPSPGAGEALPVKPWMEEKEPGPSQMCCSARGVADPRDKSP